MVNKWNDIPRFDDNGGLYYGNKPGFKHWMSRLETVWEGKFDVTFAYISDKDEQTVRTVTLQKIKISPDDTLYFMGYCHLRNRYRTFSEYGFVSPIQFKDKKLKPKKLADLLIKQQ